MPSRRTSRSLATIAASGALALWVLAGSNVGWAQPEPGTDLSPVFINDDPTASESLAQLTDDARAGRTDQAVRTMRDLLLRHAETLVVSREDPDLHVTVRDRVNALLLAPASSAMLDAYRQSAGPEAEGLLDTGHIDDLERAALLTSAGFDAAVRVAQRSVLAARFPLAYRTLAQLRNHPDLHGDRLAHARDAALQLVGAWPDDRAKALASEWIKASGSTQGLPAPLAQPAGVSRIVRSVLSAGPPTVVDDLVPMPLFTVKQVVGPEAPIVVMRAVRGVNTTNDLPMFARELRTVPSVIGDTALVVNGRDLGAFDARTLTERWRLDLVTALGLDQGGADPLPRPSDKDDSRHMSITASEDLATVGVGQGRVGVVTLTVDNARSDPTPDIITGFDLGTGEVRWSLSMTQIDPGFASLRVRGPVLIDNDITVLCCRKWQPERRLSALYLVAIDTFTGAPRWTRLVGSAGAMPYPRNPQVSDGGVLHDGVVYRSDRLGVMGAYEAFTGRPLWVRRLTPEPVQSEVPSWPWQMNVPVVHGGSLFLVSPDRREVLKVNAMSGALEQSVASERYAEAMYLVGVGDTLAAIGENRAAFVAFDKFGTEDPRLTPPLDAPGIRGRAAALVGGGSQRVLLPVLSPASGIVVVDPALPRRESMRFVRMDEPGTLTALADRVLIADDSRLRVYLRWDEAVAQLKAQLVENPEDATPAVQLVEFAYASGKSAAILPALTEAVKLLGVSSTDDGEAKTKLRTRLVTSVLDMLDSALAPSKAELEADQRRTPSMAGFEPAPLPASVIPGVLAAIEPVCVRPDEQASRLLLQSSDELRRDRPTDAVTSLQRVLADRTLAGASFKTSRLTVSAGGEATTRLETIIREHGRPVYGAFDQSLDGALAQLPPTPEPDALEKLAERFPVAKGTPALWLRAATLHAAQGLVRAEQKSLDQGLKAVARIPDPPMDVVGELSGRLVSALRERGLMVAASEQLRWVKDRYPAARLTRNGAALDEGTLGPLVADAHAWPAVGIPRAAGSQTLAGWAILTPELDDPLSRSGRFLVMQHERGKLALFGPRAGAPADAPLVELSTLNMNSDEFAQLMRVDSAGAVFYITGRAQGPRLARLDADSKAAKWMSEPFTSYFDAAKPEAKPDGAAGVRGWQRAMGVQTPMGERPANEVLLAGDDRTLAMVQRTGRTVVLDASTGVSRFASALDVVRVHDAAVISNQLVVAGQREAKLAPAAAEGAEAPADDVIAFIDARTGAVNSTIVPPAQGGAVRWLRPGVRGDLIVGMAGAIACLDPARVGEPVWTLREHPAATSNDAWLIDDRLFVLDSARELWLIDASSGQVIAGPIDTRGRIDTGGQVMINRRGQSTTATYGVRSPRGLAILSAEGVLIGADAVSNDDDGMVTPIPTANGYIGVTTPRTEVARERMFAYSLFWLDGQSAALDGSRQLFLNDDPERIAVMDGRIAVTTGHSTVILLAPRE